MPDRIQSCWQNLSTHRAVREKLVRTYIGPTHGLANQLAETTPLNFYAIYTRTLLQYLAAHQPKVRITTDVGPWKAWMELVAFQVSRVMRDVNFESKQQRWVLDALVYSPGVIKVAQEWVGVYQGDDDGEPEGSDAEGEAYPENYTWALQTLVENIDFSDWVFDTAATSVGNSCFLGHRVRIPISQALGNPMFEGISESDLRSLAGDSSWNNDDRLFFQSDDKNQPYQQTLTLWEIWNREKNTIEIYTLQGGTARGKRKLYSEKWEGHPKGPYHFIDFQDIPNHVIGLSPLCQLAALSEASNRALNKVIKQTDAAKNIFRIVGGNPAEAQTIMEALDGQGVYADGGGIAEVLTVGGADRTTMAAVPIFKDLFNWAAGNLNELAGLGVSAPTATQGELLNQAASGMARYMQQKVTGSVTTCAEAILYFELRDMITTEHVPEALPDGNTNWRMFTPDMRQQIDPILVNTTIDVYSMAYKSPVDRRNELMQWWTMLAMPAYQMWAAQGGEYDLQALFKAYADLSDLPEVNEVARYSLKPRSESSGSSEPLPIRQSPVTTRTNVRMDRGGNRGDLGGKMAASMMADAA